MKTKTLRLIALSAWCLLSLPGCMLAQQLGGIGVVPVPITVQAFVHDPEGKPVEGAEVRAAFPRYGNTVTVAAAKAVTDREGIATLAGNAYAEYLVVAEKAGYYPTDGPRRAIGSPTEFKLYAAGVQKINLELRPIKNPIHSITRFVDSLRMPKTTEPVGFDLEVGDWVTPYGKGRTADFVFKAEGYVKSSTDYDLRLSLRFSNTGDGIIQTKLTKNLGSTFQFPYEAPLVGYLARYESRKAFDGKTRLSTADLNGTTGYIFRVRSKLDEQGKVRSALYGVITQDLNFHGTIETGFDISFVYVLNPDWTRNLEFALEKQVGAETGKLPVSPPPSQ
jgi:hypothetical protein